MKPFPRVPGSPHDQGVLTVVGVVAAPDAAGLEPELFVELNRVRVRDAHLEGVAAATIVRRDVEQARQERGRDSRRLNSGATGDVHHVPGVDVARDEGVADELAGVEYAPNASALGFRSSAANIERDHGVGYDARSMTSTVSRSRCSSRRSSRFTRGSGPRIG